MKVRVPQADGEITINQAGVVKTFKVQDHVLSVDSAQGGLILASVPGSEVVIETRSQTAKKEK